MLKRLIFFIFYWNKRNYFELSEKNVIRAKLIITLCFFEIYVINSTYIKNRVNEETHYYFPDFKVNNEYIELKGSHLIDENMNLIHPKTKEILKEKTQCLKDNNVKIIVDCSEYINYVKNKYGEHFISSLKTSS